jgi:hypothetical protein
MRHIARPKFGASRVLHSRAREPRADRATSRVALSLIALGVACIGLPTASASASPATTTTLPASVLAAGTAYARHLLSEQPVPPGARTISSLPTPEGSLPVVGGTADVRSAHHFYLLPESFQVDRYVLAHLPSGENANGTGTLHAPNAANVYTLTVSGTCVSPHVTFCVIYYVSTQTKSGEQELAITAQDSYLPILHVKMPTTGVVTITGYGKTSIFGSSDPTSVVLTHDQVLQLRSAIEGMKDLGTNSGCMESSLLLKIKIVKSGKVVWSAAANDCPGALTITSTKTNGSLDNRNCTFWHAVDSFFPGGTAKGTRAARATCSTSSSG